MTIDEHRRREAFREARKVTWINRLIVAVIVVTVVGLLLWAGIDSGGRDDAPDRPVDCQVDFCP